MINIKKVLKSSQEHSEDLDEHEEETMEIDLASLLGGGDSGPGNWHTSHLTFYGPESRTLLFSGEVNEESAATFCSQLLALAEMYPDIPIVVHIDTYGGSLSAGLAIYDTMKIIPCPIITIAKGSCMSAGLILLLGGDLRLSYPLTRFMYHEPITIQHTQSLRQAEVAAQEYRLGLSTYNKIVRDHCAVNDEDWKFYFNDNLGHFFDATKAQSWGFLHQILPYANKSVSLG